MVDPTRLELVTFSMSRKRSNQLSYGSDIKITFGGLIDSPPMPVIQTWAGRDLNPHDLTATGF